jgi:hypothetical protein
MEPVVKQNNGFHELQQDVRYIKDSLVEAIDQLSSSINALTMRLEIFIEAQKEVIPVNVVWWMFMILFLLLAGKESLEFLFKHGLVH